MRPTFPIPRSAQQGFSLVEMAVVLSIIALLTGSILTGKHMIRSSEVQATTARIQEYKSAINQFTERYLELPGDFESASDYWSGTYDGNGDGTIGGSLDSSCGGDFEEQWGAFEHMAKAELIEGQYNHSGDSTPNPGVNTPATPISGGGYTLRFCGDITSSAHYFTGYYGHIIQVGHKLEASGSPSLGGTRGPLFTPEEAGSIDQKMDDSYPGSGVIKAPRKSDANAPGCTTSNDPANADYEYETGTRVCPLFFLMGF